ncbi:UNKNOWN [Stylonychia lemnae]|uniref:Homeobox domain-containing protein n=1 Tax=Stylonychia lemnae TaxID=5949 RepID=A0A078B4G5_STYLE|nr:UNKNOWN [Stylonychia lemnae]|eukprot:CDW88112.1 UNKNOWN [Stylonychia lemnae]
MEELEDYDKFYDSFFVQQGNVSKSNQNSSLSQKNSEDQFEGLLLDIFRNEYNSKGLSSHTWSRKNSTTSQIVDSGSSLKEEEQTEQKDGNIRITQEISQQDYQKQGCSFNTTNDQINFESKKHLENFQNLNKSKTYKRQQLKKSNATASAKSKEQIHFLESHFIQNQRWSNERIQEMSKEIGLTFYKIYKWNWDRRMALKKYHEQDKYCDYRYIKIFEVRKFPRNQEDVQEIISDDSTDYKIFNIRKI